MDILVNNAGQPRVAPSESLPEADYGYTLDLNLNGCFVLTQEIVRGMLAAGSGVIIQREQHERQRALPPAPRLLRLEGRPQHDDQDWTGQAN